MIGSLLSDSQLANSFESLENITDMNIHWLFYILLRLECEYLNNNFLWQFLYTILLTSSKSRKINIDPILKDHIIFTILCHASVMACVLSRFNLDSYSLYSLIIREFSIRLKQFSFLLVFQDLMVLRSGCFFFGIHSDVHKFS